jgi:bifunctional DNA-binding transcriptional regulator/antitoxin component of YhaV-PrlF toxin-antitoxin module
MAEAELVKMSSKGQLVVPESIREEEGFEPGDRFISIPIKDGVMFKKVRILDFKAEYERLAKEIRAHMKKRKITQKDLDEAIRWARRR